ncbi:MAG: hypothetical protein IPM79_30520 [Polyangiaceae bacterium]|jgi:hypothetical protein|nr:hypothetical protein [Polyangiaceae bacterium]MBK8941819.1 hypothetical protein [Polyangiaceae bacterium]
MTMRPMLAAAALALVVAAAPREALAQDSAASSGGMQSPFAFALGLILTGAGGAGLAVGGHLYSQGTDACDAIPRDRMPSEQQIDDCRSSANGQVAGIVSMVTGGAFVLGGIPLVIAGAIPESEAPNSSVVLNVEPTGAQLTITF